MIKKAVIPAAGFGTRFLPATKAQPKEMLPIIDTPVIQYVVEEALAAGLDDILIITGRGKHSIINHFDRSMEMEYYLKDKGRDDLVEQLQKISELADIYTIRQKQTNGLGDAILYARQHIANDPFCVMLGDTIMETFGERNCTGQLIDMFQRVRRPIIAVEEVPRERVDRYGIVSGKEVAPNTYLIERLVEKPKPDEAPSNLAITGRYLLTPEIFLYLDRTPKGLGGELQLTDALNLMCAHEQIFAYKFDGRRHDIGNRLDYLKTTVLFALKRPDLKDKFRAFLETVLSEANAVSSKAKN
ncbi:MAG: UTP--glucose-1-phosphate uridylyltransferase GalU [Candidatus Sumerlaeota bacterium]|nr:UTP--glucose-1-phosphate uridylyltransferase GalU [Candidatus Sumerlaeota bacterium]